MKSIMTGGGVQWHVQQKSKVRYRYVLYYRQMPKHACIEIMFLIIVIIT